MKRCIEEVPVTVVIELPQEVKDYIFLLSFNEGKVARKEGYERLIDLLTVQKRMMEVLVRNGITVLCNEALSGMPYKLFQQFQNLEKIILPDVFSDPDNHLLKLTRLTSLNTSYNEGVRNLQELTQLRHLTTLKRKCQFIKSLTRLESLTIGVSINDDLLDKHMYLTRLVYRSAMDLTEKTLSQLTSLKHLELSLSQLKPDIQLSSIMPNLTYFYAFRLENDQPLANITTLTCLRLWTPRMKSFTTLSTLINLTQLDLISPYCEPNVHIDEQIQHLTQLRHIRLDGPYNILGHGLSQLSNLEVLILHNARLLEDRALSHLTSLSTLLLAGGHNLKGRFLPQLSNTLVDLTILGGSRVQDNYLKELTNLRHLSLENPLYITNGGLRTLTSLKQLYLNHPSEHITEDGIIPLKLLEMLVIRESGSIIKPSIVSHLTKLQHCMLEGKFIDTPQSPTQA